MQNPVNRIRMLETLLVAPEYVASARRAGIYSNILQYIHTIRSGEMAYLPYEQVQQRAPQQQPPQQQKPTMAALNAIQERMGTMNISPGASAATAVANQIQQYQEPQRPAWQVVAATPTNKALSFFQQCLQVLHIDEGQSLTEEQLKAAYKKAAVRAHPDKGGNEKQFEAVTRAYAYLSEILQRIRGNRKTTGEIDAPAITTDKRATEAKKWETVQPVRLDPKNLNMTSFNSLYEQTRLPDPDDDGYGDWLKGNEGEEPGANFGGKFNRDVFMKTFEEKAKKKAAQTTLIVHPELMALNSGTGGVELGREKATTFTAAANASLKYTDLRDAYTKENTISPQVANVRVEDRNWKDYKNSYKAGPAPMTADEMQQLREEEEKRKQYENVRMRRAAEESIAATAYFDRMKQLVLTR